MADVKDGGPAFPRVSPLGDPATFGMTLRDYFAGQAVIGVAEKLWSDPRDLARVVYQIADAMVKVREAKSHVE